MQVTRTEKRWNANFRSLSVRHTRRLRVNRKSVKLGLPERRRRPTIPHFMLSSGTHPRRKPVTVPGWRLALFTQAAAAGGMISWSQEPSAARPGARGPGLSKSIVGNAWRGRSPQLGLPMGGAHNVSIARLGRAHRHRRVRASGLGGGRLQARPRHRAFGSAGLAAPDVEVGNHAC